jgi:hypothetical protein
MPLVNILTRKHHYCITHPETLTAEVCESRQPFLLILRTTLDGRFKGKSTLVYGELGEVERIVTYGTHLRGRDFGNQEGLPRLIRAGMCLVKGCQILVS